MATRTYKPVGVLTAEQHERLSRAQLCACFDCSQDEAIDALIARLSDARPLDAVANTHENAVKMTDEMLDKIAESVRNGFTLEAAAWGEGVPRSACVRLAQHPRIKEALDAWASKLQRRANATDPRLQ